MGNMSQLAHITQAAVVIMFADLALISASRANQVMDRFPGYRSAKGSADDSFWLREGVEMLTACKAELASCDEAAGGDEDFCG